MGPFFRQDGPHPAHCDVGSPLPGHGRVLPEEQQHLLGVEEERPAGEAGEKQHQGGLLQDDPHMLQVLAPIRLRAHGQNKPISRETAPPGHPPPKAFNPDPQRWS